MAKPEFIVEYGTGKVSLSRANMLFRATTNMEEVEFWEERLKMLKQPYVVAYRVIEDKVCYTIFTNVRGKDSIFK